MSGITTGVIVTGGASGIGSACGAALAAAGRPVALWDLDEAAAAEHADRIAKEHGVPVVGMRVDVRDAGAYPEALERSRSALGGLGGLVHAAGVVDSGSLPGLEPDMWDLVLDVNLRAQALLVRAMLDDLRTHPGSAVVGVASINAVVGNPANPAYCASKAGLLGLTRSLAASLATDGIRVNAVCPGYIETPMLAKAFERPGNRAKLESRPPLKRLGTPDEIAGAVRFLMGAEASYITGTHLLVDGGLTATV